MKFIETKTDTLVVLQITDTHIFADKNDRLDGIDTTASLEQVIFHINQSTVVPDVILLTGDLVHDRVEAAYNNLKAKLIQFDAPVFCIPGNHDDPEIMQALLNSDNIRTTKVINTKDWAIILLDSFLANTHAGRLNETELRFLQEQLELAKGKHVFICLHHPPVSINSPWMDSMMLEDPDEFFAVVDKFDHVRGILWGHIHQEFQLLRNKVQLLASPSTCIQFTPLAEEYKKDGLPAAYRVINLASSGTIHAEVNRVHSSHNQA